MVKKNKFEDENWDDLDLDDDQMETDWNESEDNEGHTEDPAPTETHNTTETSEATVDVEAEDSVRFPSQYYTTVEDYEYGGRPVPAGSNIEVACENCGVWETPLDALDGKSLCKPGLPVQVKDAEGQETTWQMAPQRFSCQNYFIPQEMEDLLSFVTDDVDQLRYLSWVFPTIEAFCKFQDRVRKHAEKSGIKDPSQLVDNAANFAMMFQTSEQAKYVKPFIKAIYKHLQAKYQPKSAPKGKGKSTYVAGAEVEWDDLGSGQRVSGVIRAVGGAKRLITLLVSGDSAAALQPEYAEKWQTEHPDALIDDLVIQVRYNFKDWRDERNPAVKAAAVVFDEFDSEKDQ